MITSLCSLATGSHPFISMLEGEMPANCAYHWARRSIPADLWTLGDLALLLGIGRHQARRVLLKSGVPCCLVAKHWRDKHTGRGFTRKAWALPGTAALLLLLVRIRQEITVDAKALRVPTPAVLDVRIAELASSLNRNCRSL